MNAHYGPMKLAPFLEHLDPPPPIRLNSLSHVDKKGAGPEDFFRNGFNIYQILVNNSNHARRGTRDAGRFRQVQ
jgi:hypothetical protein